MRPCYKFNWLMPLREVTAVYFEKHTKAINAVCKYSYRCAFKC
jgi:hypothetical protein